MSGPTTTQQWEVSGVRVMTPEAYRRSRPAPPAPAAPPPPPANDGKLWLSGAMVRGEIEAPVGREAQLAAGRASPADDRIWIPIHSLTPGTDDYNDPVAYVRTLGVHVRGTAPEAQPEAQPIDELTDHNYDGIQEYDNPTPGWWWMIFYGSVVFSVFYVVVFHFSGMVPNLGERHAAKVERMLEVQFAELNDIPLGGEKLLTIMNEPAWLARGESVFKRTCALCHNQDGSGLVGPNLTDEVYINIKSLDELAAFVNNGSPKGTMPPRGGGLLNDNEVALAAAYAASLRGKDLPSQRPPEGEPIPPWPTPAGG